MKSRFVKTLILAVIIVSGIWVLSNRDQINKPGDVVTLIKQKLGSAQVGFSRLVEPEQSEVPLSFQFDTQNASPSAYPVSSRRPQFVSNVIRIASFRLNSLVTKQPNSSDLEIIADMCRQYDAVALQEVDAGGQLWLRELTDRMNRMGATGGSRSLGRQSSSDYFFVSDHSRNPSQATLAAIVFNRRTLELDQSKWYTVNDPERVLTREPMVAWFRARGPAPDRAFTFSLVNIKFGSKESELRHLGELFRAIRDDGRQEDDVLIVGDFNGDTKELQPLRKRAGLTWVVSNRTNTTGVSSLFDNLVFNDIATVEFTGRGGSFDFLRKYNLKLEDAIRISEHMPVWAEFSVFEGGNGPLPVGNASQVPGRVAGNQATFQPRTLVTDR